MLVAKSVHLADIDQIIERLEGRIQIDHLQVLHPVLTTLGFHSYKGS